MSNDGNELEINVPNYRIDDVIQASAQGRSASITPGTESVDLGALPGTESGTERINAGIFPVTEITSEGGGLLSVRYVNAVPVLVISGGTSVPAQLTVVDGAGTPVGQYTAEALPSDAPRTIQSRASSAYDMEKLQER
ncbi:hypothetical protein [Streptomyces sp. NPDC046385]|uniref:hypothetical protein n=1 Tax=Streptomyces sp. NPDC046385 TaxID=3154918 RepID=UPI00340AFE0E